MTRITDCPSCGERNALETFLRIDLDEVVLDQVGGQLQVVGFVPAHSADDPATGIVVEEATISCRDCGAEVESAYVPRGILRDWAFASEKDWALASENLGRTMGKRASRIAAGDTLAHGGKVLEVKSDCESGSMTIVAETVTVTLSPFDSLEVIARKASPREV
jgi:hypothetical protein